MARTTQALPTRNAFMQFVHEAREQFLALAGPEAIEADLWLHDHMPGEVQLWDCLAELHR